MLSGLLANPLYVRVRKNQFCVRSLESAKEATFDAQPPFTTARLLIGAIAYARKQGATLLEAYPVDKPGRSKDDYMWFGAKSMYDGAGFKEVARRKPQRPVVRLKPV